MVPLPHSLILDRRYGRYVFLCTRKIRNVTDYFGTIIKARHSHARTGLLLSVSMILISNIVTGTRVLDIGANSGAHPSTRYFRRGHSTCHVRSSCSLNVDQWIITITEYVSRIIKKNETYKQSANKTISDERRADDD